MNIVHKFVFEPVPVARQEPVFYALMGLYFPLTVFDGTTYKAGQIVAINRKRHGEDVCLACMKKRKDTEKEAAEAEAAERAAEQQAAEGEQNMETVEGDNATDE